MPEMPPEAISQIQDNIMDGKANRFGSVPFNVFMGANGDANCLSEAPSAEAVCQSHAAVGAEISPSDIHEVGSLV